MNNLERKFGPQDMDVSINFFINMHIYKSCILKGSLIIVIYNRIIIILKYNYLIKRDKIINSFQVFVGKVTHFRHKCL